MKSTWHKVGLSEEEIDSARIKILRRLRGIESELSKVNYSRYNSFGSTVVP